MSILITPGAKKVASSHQVRQKADTNRPAAELQWEVVKPPTNVNPDGTFNEEDNSQQCDKDHIHGQRTSAHFDLHLGWGKWKWKVFGIDYDRTQGSRHDGNS
jgi:hypothetical protein